MKPLQVTDARRTYSSGSQSSVPLWVLTGQLLGLDWPLLEVATGAQIQMRYRTALQKNRVLLQVPYENLL